MAAIRAVEVTLVRPARNDYRLAGPGRCSSLDDLLTSDVRLALLRGGLLNTWRLMIDGQLVNRVERRALVLS